MRRLTVISIAVLTLGWILAGAFSWAQPADENENSPQVVDKELNVKSIIEEWIPDGELVGAAPYKYMMWNVYDIALYAPEGRYSESGPQALALTYKRELKGKAIADRSSKLMRELGCTDEVRLAGWHSSMKMIFPDVDEGTMLIGVQDENGKTIFLSDDQVIGKVEDPEFGNCFFAIWLDEKTTEPELRAELLGSS